MAAGAHETRGDFPLARNTLVTANLSLVKFLMDRIGPTLPGHVDRDDLRSAAMVGLVSAAERFDPSRGVQFNTFAEQRIRGAILDELRSHDCLTRGLRDKSKWLERESAQLEQRLGRKPACDDLAQTMGISLEDYHRMVEDTHVLPPVSLDDDWQDEDGAGFGLLDVLEDTSTKSPQSQMIARQTVELLAGAIDALPEKERVVITLYYYEELNLKEIGAVLDLTESRISQLHHQGVVRLRSKMKGQTGAEE